MPAPSVWGVFPFEGNTNDATGLRAALGSDLLSGYTTGKIGQGVIGFVYVETGPFPDPASAYSFCFWMDFVNGDGTQANFQLNKAAGASGKFLIASLDQVDATHVKFTIDGVGAAVTATTALSPGLHHYAFTFNGTSTWKVYYDGASVATLTSAYNTGNVGAQISLSSFGSDTIFDEWIINTGRWTDDEVAFIYSEGNAGRSWEDWVVATVPEAVDDLDGTPGTNSIEFTWSAPADGGASITKYTLYLNGVLHADNVTSPHEVTGLTGGVASGPWTVKSTNSVGQSGPSNAVTETPYDIPDAVDDLDGAADVQSITFTWSEPDENGSDITKYTLYLNGVEHTDDVESPHEVTGLTGGAASGPWTVTATNAAGESDPSNAVTETPELPDTPVVTAATVNGTQHEVLTYQILSTNDPTSFAVDQLPDGLKLDGETGIISGRPKFGETIQVSVTATNEAGDGEAILTFIVEVVEVLPKPTITFQVNLFPANPNPVTDLIGYADNLEHRSRQASTMSFLNGVTYHHGDTFIAHGAKALRLKANYTNGIVGSFESTPLKIISEM